MNKAKLQSVNNGKLFLRERFKDVETTFISELKREQGANTHNTALGDATEEAWLELLKRYLPARYKIAKAFAVDHLGHTTDQLDSLIYDAHFTPALFGKGNSLYVPAEAVYATFEIKPEISAKYIKAAAEKVQSLRLLQRTSAPLAYANGINEPKPLFPIMGGLFGMSASWKDGLGRSFITQIGKYTGNQNLDLVLTAEDGFYEKSENGRYELVTGHGSLIRGLLRLVNTLRTKASVPAVEWEKYEEVFED